MPLLTDAPAAARPLLAPGERLREVAPADLGPEAEGVWRGFVGAGSAFVAGGALGERVVLLRDEAPRSQYAVMNEVLAAGGSLPDGLACLALTGARFQGQRGRAWTALRGNLHLSVHLALDLDAAEHQVGLTVLPAVATARAIESVSDGRVRPGTKWVNDLMLGGCKVAGVLTATQLHRGRLRHAVLGIGVNVARAPALPPAPRVPRPGSLADADGAFAGDDAWARLLPPLLAELERGRALLAAGGGATLVAEYRARATFVGRAVTIWPVDEAADADVRPLAQGVVRALRDDLALELEGVDAPVRHGRMTLDPPA
jgi:BirA family biotin operon repressor/biotin-[acetyl-CoA-carboxylase] ligase